MKLSPLKKREAISLVVDIVTGFLTSTIMLATLRHPKHIKLGVICMLALVIAYGVWSFHDGRTRSKLNP